MNSNLWLVGAFAPAFIVGVAEAAEPTSPVYYGFRAERIEARINDNSEVYALDADAYVGTDELKLVWRGEWEYSEEEDAFELFENQARLQFPISTFFDAVVGAAYDAPKGPNRAYGVVGVKGLAPQWFEVDLDLFISDEPLLRFEAEYEALITQRITLTPSIEIDLPLTNDEPIGNGAFAPLIEVGARLSYDLIDRAVSPYIGVHYELKTEKSGRLAQADGENKDDLFFVAGVRLKF